MKNLINIFTHMCVFVLCFFNIQAQTIGDLQTEINAIEIGETWNRWKLGNSTTNYLGTATSLKMG